MGNQKQADWHHWEWWKGLGSHVAGDKTIRDRCGVYSGDCRQEVTPWQDIREHSTGWDYEEQTTVCELLSVVWGVIIMLRQCLLNGLFEKCCIIPNHSRMSCVSCVSVLSIYFCALCCVPWTRPKCLHWYLYLSVFALSSGLCSGDKGQVHCCTRAFKGLLFLWKWLRGHLKMHPQPLGSVCLQHWATVAHQIPPMRPEEPPEVIVATI